MGTTPRTSRLVVSVKGSRKREESQRSRRTTPPDRTCERRFLRCLLGPQRRRYERGRPPWKHERFSPPGWSLLRPRSHVYDQLVDDLPGVLYEDRWKAPWNVYRSISLSRWAFRRVGAVEDPAKGPGRLGTVDTPRT